MTYKNNPVTRDSAGAEKPRIIHDNGAIATFSDGTVVNRQHGTVHQRGGLIQKPSGKQSEHMNVAMRDVAGDEKHPRMR